MAGIFPLTLLHSLPGKEGLCIIRQMALIRTPGMPKGRQGGARRRRRSSSEALGLGLGVSHEPGSPTLEPKPLTAIVGATSLLQ